MKINFSLIAGIALVCGLVAPEAESALISHYAFDGSTNDSVPGGPAGTIVDFNPGSPASGLGTGRVGTGSLRLEFGDYMHTTTAGRPTGNDLDSGTIAMWIKTAPNLTNGQLANITLMGTLNTAPDSTALLFGTNGVGNLQLFPRSSDGSQARPRLAPGGNINTLDRSWADGNWHHIAVTYSHGAANGASTGQWYIDGLPINTNMAEQLLNNNDTFNPWQHNMLFGARNNRGTTIDQFLPGGMMLDDIRIYNMVLSPSEISRLVPEPSSVLLLLLGLAGTLRSRFGVNIG